MSVDLILSQYLFALGRALPHWLVVFLATYLIWLMFAVALMSIRRIALERPWCFLLQVVLVILSARAAKFIISLIYFRLRPFASLEFNPLISMSSLSASFPSAHAAIAWALVFFLWPYRKKFRLVGVAMLVPAVLVTIGRVLAGVHFVSDVAAGVAVGLMVATLARRLFRGHEV